MRKRETQRARRQDVRVGVQRLEVDETAADKVDCHGVATWAVLRQKRQPQVIHHRALPTHPQASNHRDLLVDKDGHGDQVVRRSRANLDELAPTLDEPDAGLHADLGTGALDDEVDRFEPTLPETKLLHNVLALAPCQSSHVQRDRQTYVSLRVVLSGLARVHRDSKMGLRANVLLGELEPRRVDVNGEDATGSEGLGNSHGTKDRV